MPMMLRASGSGSPSVASPSLMLMTMGGKESGCRAVHCPTALAAYPSAVHMGVCNPEWGWSQTGILRASSMVPPPPSLSLTRLSSRSAMSAIFAKGRKGLSSPVSGSALTMVSRYMVRDCHELSCWSKGMATSLSPKEKYWPLWSYPVSSA